jgi:hypothetical protein
MGVNMGSPEYITNPYDPDKFNPNLWLKQEAEDLALPAKGLLALSPARDPFNKGTKAHWMQAEWFATVYQRYGQRDMHLRRLHYRMVNAAEQVFLWDGTPYENDRRCWSKLNDAFACARILRTVDAFDFSENRVKDPRVDSIRVRNGTEGPRYEIEEPSLWSLPHAPGATDMPNVSDVSHEPYLALPQFGIYGYAYDPSMQAHLVEIWSEKSGDDATIRGVTHQFGINYQPGIGYQSITNIKRMLRRVQEHGKPAVILYISDYDAAGQNMPVQVSRHCQFAAWELEELAYEEAPEIRVDSVALTAELVEELNLPPIPGRSSVPR